MCRGWLTIFLLSRRRLLSGNSETYINNFLNETLRREKHVYRGDDIPVPHVQKDAYRQWTEKVQRSYKIMVACELRKSGEIGYLKEN